MPTFSVVPSGLVSFWCPIPGLKPWAILRGPSGTLRGKSRGWMAGHMSGLGGRGRGRGLVPEDAGGEVAEALAGRTFLSKTREDGSQFRDDVFAFNGIFVETVEAGAGFVAAEINLVFVGGF